MARAAAFYRILSEGTFDAEDSADEVIYAGIDVVVTVLVFRGNGVRSAVELSVETGYVTIEEGLFVGRKGSKIVIFYTL